MRYYCVELVAIVVVASTVVVAVVVDSAAPVVVVATSIDEGNPIGPAPEASGGTTPVASAGATSGGTFTSCTTGLSDGMTAGDCAGKYFQYANPPPPRRTSTIRMIVMTSPVDDRLVAAGTAAGITFVTEATGGAAYAGSDFGIKFAEGIWTLGIAAMGGSICVPGATIPAPGNFVAVAAGVPEGDAAGLTVGITPICIFIFSTGALIGAIEDAFESGVMVGSAA